MTDDAEVTKVPREQMKKREIEAPVCLGDLFAENDDEKEAECFSQLYEDQDLDIGGTMLKIRQFAWHGANANKVWPGTFNLAEHICVNKGDDELAASQTDLSCIISTIVTHPALESCLYFLIMLLPTSIIAPILRYCRSVQLSSNSRAWGCDGSAVCLSF